MLRNIQWPGAPCKITDGNGIIIDDSKHTQNGSTLGPYYGKTYIANNLVYGNGGAGVHIYSSEHVTVINNTVFENQQTPVIFNGEIDASSSSDIIIRNNILFAANNKPINTNWNNSNIIHDYNLYYGGNGSFVSGSNILTGNPMFVNATLMSDADFQVNWGSPSIDNGTNLLAPIIDFKGDKRPQGNSYDIGAYESRCTSTTTPAPTGTAAQSFCSGSSPTIESLTVTGTLIQWYAASSGGPALLSTDALTSTNYYASQTISGCESYARFKVAVTVAHPPAPTGSATQSFCSGASPSVANLAANGTAIQWYDAASAGNLLAGSTALVNGTHYYSSQTVSACESSARLDVMAMVTTTPGAPVGSATQTYCSGEGKVISDLTAKLTGTGIIWYDAATAGHVVAGTATLATGNYYASQTVSGCESTLRKAVAVTVNTTPSAPTGSATQSFCLGASPTVANLTAIGNAIQWYDAAIAGNLLAGSTALVNGTHYYSSQMVSACESSARLDVTAILTITLAPTGSATQSFCSETSPTIANLTATGIGIKWYAASSGGSALATSTTLINGTHYYASQTVSACESPTRFDVTVTITPAPTANAGPVLSPICQGGTTAALGGSVGGSATGGTWTTPEGGTFTPSANTLNAAWTPSAGYSGTATLTLTATGVTCRTATASKTQVVNAGAAIALTSAAGTSSQTVCMITSITNITYSVTGSGTGAEVTGLPTGVTGSYSGGVYTISGRPIVAGTFNYTVTTTGTCAQASSSGSLTVNTPVLTVTPETKSVSKMGGHISFDVANEGCGYMDWTSQIITNTPWISIISGFNGVDSGKINCSIEENNMEPIRIATIRINTYTGSKDVSVLQGGTGISDHPFIFKVKVYPNPTSGKITLEIDNTGLADAKYIVVDLIGRFQLTGTINQNVSQLDLSPLSQGVYFLQVSNSLGEYFITKIIRD